MQKSRVERVIRELDPGDVSLLHRVNVLRVEQAENDDFPREGMARFDLLSQHPGASDILHASGCVSREHVSGFDGGTTTDTITTIGLNVLEILDRYVEVLEADAGSVS